MTDETSSSQHARKSPIIRFLGAFDSVKAFDDSGLYDINLLENVRNVRHAMALFERRQHFHLERFSMDGPRRPIDQDTSFQESWFLGAHGDIGGACKSDGLSLWPLQWMVAEAQRFGLHLQLGDEAESPTQRNVVRLIFPSLELVAGEPVPEIRTNALLKAVVHHNGLSVIMDDLPKRTFGSPGFEVCLESAGSSLDLLTKPRAIFEEDGTLRGCMHKSPQENRSPPSFINRQGQPIRGDSEPSGTFIHPSIFWMDHNTPMIIRALNNFHLGQQIRKQEDFIQERSREVWDLSDMLKQDKETEKPRILVCGESGAGKSTIINEFLGKDAVSSFYVECICTNSCLGSRAPTDI